MTKADTHWDQRVLCSDGNCIGVIGADGRCKACGMIYEGELPVGTGQPDGPAEAIEDTGEEFNRPDDDHRTDDTTEGVPDRAEDAWEDRTLCADESCIGVIGTDGNCKECGKPYRG